MATIVRLPHNWKPRTYQLKAWTYLENGGTRANLIWHRRSGKDEIALHRSACAAFERVGNYWHMLPQAEQARKAIWEAVNPRTGLRRIDEAFPLALRAATRNQEMMIRFKNGSTWQVVGSDNYNSLVGSPPIGITLSEWALANPAAWAYLRPILLENNGWAIFITTPRGNNHAKRMYEAAKRSMAEGRAFAQLLTAEQTGVFTAKQLEEEKQSLIDDYGEEYGTSSYEQEYLCSFDAAILGSYYGKEIRKLELAGRIGAVPYDPNYVVHTAWDLGFTDDTAIWFFQVVGGELRIIDYYASSGQGLEHYAQVLADRKYKYARIHWLPHDAQAKQLAANGKTIQQQLYALGISTAIAPNVSLEHGHQAVRATLKSCVFDDEHCAHGLDGLRQYRREWDDDKKCFKDRHVHDWTSHPADAFRYLALVWREVKPEPAPPDPRFPVQQTFNELRDAVSRRKRDPYG